jgi:hypothetical protein
MEISGGAKIKANFYQIYSEYEGQNACADYNDQHIQ